MIITTIKKQVKLATFIGLALGSTFSLFSLNTLAGTSTANPKATATISAVCNISAQNLGFGSLVLPIASQTGAYPTPDYYMDTVTATVSF